jgi:hypothetical protein
MQIQRSVVYERATIKLIEMLICFQHKASAQKGISQKQLSVRERSGNYQMHIIGMSVSYIALTEGQRCSVNLQVALPERNFMCRVLKHISSEYGEIGMPCVPSTDCLSLTILWW